MLIPRTSRSHPAEKSYTLKNATEFWRCGPGDCHIHDNRLGHRSRADRLWSARLRFSRTES